MEMTIREWQQRFINKEFDQLDVSTQCKAGWYDWFCKDSSLAGKTRKLGSIVRRIKDGGKVNLDTSYVFFKNNCPMRGPLYDDFRICNIEANNVIFTITMDDRRADTKFEVYGRTPDHPEGIWGKPIIGFNTAKELLNWLNRPW